MSNIDDNYLNELVTRFKAYKSPNDTQKLIITLGEKIERSDDDNKKLAVLVRAEKKYAELMKARAATNRIINAEKTAARKLDARKKIIWGAALKTASKDSPQIAQLMLKMFNDGYISKADLDVVRDDLTYSNNDSY